MEQISENQALLELIRKLKEEPSLIEKFSNVDNPESMYNIALSISDGYTKEEFLNFMKYLQNVNEQRNSDNHTIKLDDNNLDKVSGGRKLKLSGESKLKLGKFLDETCEFLDCGGTNILYLLTNF